MQTAISDQQNIEILQYILNDDRQFPNNERLALLIYRQVIHTVDADKAEEIFERNGWLNSWQNGVCYYHHYHSNTHEVLGIIRGVGRLQFGGENGIEIPVEAGDVIIIPAGVAHKCLEHGDDFLVVGAYPGGVDYNILIGKSGERPEADEDIKKVPMPSADPVFGTDGPLLKNWRYV